MRTLKEIVEAEKDYFVHHYRTHLKVEVDMMRRVGRPNFFIVEVLDRIGTVLPELYMEELLETYAAAGKSDKIEAVCNRWLLYIQRQATLNQRRIYK